MQHAEIANKIREKALALGYEQCGIIPISDMQGYAAALEKRIAQFPESRDFFQECQPFTELKERYPWARSVVICSLWYGDYHVPRGFKGQIAKYFLTDFRRNENTAAYGNSFKFEEYLHSLSLRAVTERDDELLAVRWAAVQAGLGIIRNNNFLYSNKGSWLTLHAWLIDKDLELKHAPEIEKCPDNCLLCARACPTGALGGRFSTNPCSCICYLTYALGHTADSPYNAKTEQWIYGCDVCQDVCPFNKHAWTLEKDFPGLDELAGVISLEQIIATDYATLSEILVPKFWYIGPDKLWKWKCSALNAMANDYSEKYRPYIELARQDEHEQVRTMAKWVAGKVGL